MNEQQPQIRWNNIVAALLATAAFLYVWSNRDQAKEFVSKAAHIGPGNSSEDVTLGLLAMGIACVTLVAVIRLLTTPPRN